MLCIPAVPVGQHPGCGERGKTDRRGKMGQGIFSYTMKFFCEVDIELFIGIQNNARGRHFKSFQCLHSEWKDLKENSAF